MRIYRRVVECSSTMQYPLAHLECSQVLHRTRLDPRERLCTRQRKDKRYLRRGTPTQEIENPKPGTAFNYQRNTVLGPILTEDHVPVRIRASNAGRRTSDVRKGLDTSHPSSHSLPKCLLCATEVVLWSHSGVEETSATIAMYHVREVVLST